MLNDRNPKPSLYENFCVDYLKTKGVEFLDANTAEKERLIANARHILTHLQEFSKKSRQASDLDSAILSVFLVNKLFTALIALRRQTIPPQTLLLLAGLAVEAEKILSNLQEIFPGIDLEISLRNKRFKEQLDAEKGRLN